MENVWQVMQDMRNRVDFRLREWVRWQRGGLKFENQPKDHLFAFLTRQEKQQAEETAARLISQYHLESFSQNSTRINFRENLFYLSILENAFIRAGVTLPAVLSAADIGPAHWFYVQALYAGLTWYGTQKPRQVDLTGFEADAYRVFSSFYSLLDYAKAHIRNLPVVYCPEAFETIPAQFDLICLFFPFVFVKDHLEWRLPKSRFDPLKLRIAVRESLAPDGIVLVVNQGQEEHAAEKQYLTEAGMKVLANFEQEDLLYRYDLKRFVLVAKNEQ